MRFSAAFILTAYLLAAPLQGGCVQTEKPREAAERITLVLARSSKGTELRWNSRPGGLYSVQFKPRGAPHYRYQPQAINLRAPGNEMVYLDTAPDAATRSYRIHPFPVTGKPVSAGQTQP